MEQKIALITGVTNGTGLAMTRHFANNGSLVIAADIVEKGLSKLNSHKNILPLKMAVTSSESIKKGIKKLQNFNIDGIDVLINNAGIFKGGPLVELSDKDFEAILKVNVIGTFLVTKYFFSMILKRKGKIINMSSEVGRFSFPFNGPCYFSQSILRIYVIHQLFPSLLSS